METKDLASVAFDARKPTLGEHESAGSRDDAGPDARRRRIVRGALAAAPVMLTLRSGVGAASSACIPAKVVSLTLDGTGQFPTGTADPIDDTCFEVVGTNSPECAAHKDGSFISRTGYIDLPGKVVGEESGNLICGTPGDKFTSTTVAILSSQGTASFLGN